MSAFVIIILIFLTSKEFPITELQIVIHDKIILFILFYDRSFRYLWPEPGKMYWNIYEHFWNFYVHVVRFVGAQWYVIKKGERCVSGDKSMVTSVEEIFICLCKRGRIDHMAPQKLTSNCVVWTLMLSQFIFFFVSACTVLKCFVMING